MGKTKRYSPPYKRTNYRYFTIPWLKHLKKTLRSKRKSMKKVDVGNGANYNKQATDSWWFD